MLKAILSVVAGLVIAFALVFATDSLFHLAPSATAIPADPTDREAMRRYVASQPASLLVVMVLGWAVAAFAGSALAVRFANRGPRPGWTVTGLFFLATVANFFTVPHPAWMVAAGIVGILAAGWFGTRYALRKAPRQFLPS